MSRRSDEVHTSMTTLGRFWLTGLLRRGSMPAVFRVFALMRLCFEYKLNPLTTADSARVMVSVIHSVLEGGGRTRL